MRGSRFDLSWARIFRRRFVRCGVPQFRRIGVLLFRVRGSVYPLIRDCKKVERRAGAPTRRRSGRSSVVHEGAFQSLALTACTRARARHSTTLLPGTRASFGTRAAALAWHPLFPPNRRMPRCTMSSMPATTLATADKMELRMVTQRSTIGASSSSSAASPVRSSHVKWHPTM